MMSKLRSRLSKMWTVQHEEEENPRTGPNKNPGDAEGFGTETSSDLEKGGEKHKAPDEKKRPVKQ